MARWFRSHASKLNKPKVLRLSDKLYRAWDCLLCVACEFDGVLPPLADTALLLRKGEKETEALIEDLIKREFFVRTERGIEPHQWNEWQYKSDVSTNRVKQFRKRQRNVSVTPSESESETDTETDTEAKASAADAARNAVWQCMPWLMKATGKTRGQLGGVVGGWCKDYGETAVLAAFQQAQHESPAEPISWITAKFRPRDDKGQEIRDAIARGLNS